MIPFLPALGVGYAASKLFGKKPGGKPSGRLGALGESLLGEAGTSATDSQTFRTGLSEALGVQRRQAQADAGAAAARGLTGGAFEVAQAANRADSTRGAFGDLMMGAESARVQRQGLGLRALTAQEQLEEAARARRAQERAARNQGLFGLGAAAADFFGRGE